MTAERMPPNAVRARVKRISNKPPQRHAMIFSIKKGDKANALPLLLVSHTYPRAVHVRLPFLWIENMKVEFIVIFIKLKDKIAVVSFVSVQ